MITPETEAEIVRETKEHLSLEQAELLYFCLMQIQANDEFEDAMAGLYCAVRGARARGES